MVMIIVTVDFVSRIGGCDRLSVDFTGKCEQEGCNVMNLILCEFHSALIDRHITHSFFKCLTGSIMEVWPCVLHITKSRNLESVTVALVGSLLEASIVFNCKFFSSFSEIVASKSHELI